MSRTTTSRGTGRAPCPRTSRPLSRTSERNDRNRATSTSHTWRTRSCDAPNRRL
jgi:hypothetical protein